MGRELIRVGLAGAHRGAHERRVKRSSCSTNFIQQPTSGQQVDVVHPVSFVWDPTCLNITAADIYLYAPYESTPLIQMFQSVDFAKGSYNATLKPKWWNSSASVNLQLKMVQSGDQIFQATLPPGPIWVANYNASEAGADALSGGTDSSDSNSNVTQVDNLATNQTGGGISKGAIAAAVLVPLIVIGIALAVYVKLSRAREAKSRKRWSEKVDQRMSVISLDWRAMSLKGAEAAIRASTADPNRTSMWSGGSGNGAGIGIQVQRPTSSFVIGEPSEIDGDATQMTQIRRPGVGLRGTDSAAAGGAARVSRISFAADTRFSKASVGDSYSRRATAGTTPGTGSRALRSSYMPPVPSRLSEFVQEGGTNSNAESNAYIDAHRDDSGSGGSSPGVGYVSPKQREGPGDLSAADIQARLKAAHGDAPSRPSIDEMMPALNMMRIHASESESSSDSGFKSTSDTGSGSNGSLARVAHATAQPKVKAKSTEKENMKEKHVPAPLQLAAAAVAATLKSPVSDAMPMHPMHSIGSEAALSPDAMMRAYASRRAAGSNNSSSSGKTPPGTPPVISYPMPIAIPAGMRALYSPPPLSVMANAGANAFAQAQAMAMAHMMPMPPPSPMAMASPSSMEPSPSTGSVRSAGSAGSTGSNTNPFRQSVAPTPTSAFPLPSLDADAQQQQQQESQVHAI